MPSGVVAKWDVKWNIVTIVLLGLGLWSESLPGAWRFLPVFWAADHQYFGRHVIHVDVEGPSTASTNLMLKYHSVLILSLVFHLFTILTHWKSWAGLSDIHRSLEHRRMWLQWLLLAWHDTTWKLNCCDVIECCNQLIPLPSFGLYCLKAFLLKERSFSIMPLNSLPGGVGELHTKLDV